MNTLPVDDTIQIYLSDINRIPVLSRDEEERLIRKAKNGDKGAYDHVIQANLRFVVKIAYQYAHDVRSFPDLVSEGNTGLIEALNKFDPDRGFKFISYAVWWVRQRMIAYMKENYTVRVPNNVSDVAHRIHRHQEKMSQSLEYAPSIDETIEDLKGADAVLRLPEYAQSIGGQMIIENALAPSKSLNRPLRKDDDSVSVTHAIDLIEDINATPVDQGPQNQEAKNFIQTALNNALSARETQIVCLYFGIGTNEEPMTFESIGQTLGLTRERIRQIVQKSLHKLKKHLTSKVGGNVNAEDLLPLS